jgi:hypothetical protein
MATYCGQWRAEPPSEFLETLSALIRFPKISGAAFGIAGNSNLRSATFTAARVSGKTVPQRLLSEGSRRPESLDRL